MFRRLFKTYRTPFVVLVTVLLPLAVYRSHTVRPSRALLVDKIILAATAPVRALLMNSTGTVSDLWSRYVDVVGVRRQAFDLARENGRLKRRIERLQPLRVENTELRRLLRIREDNPKLQTLTGSVIGVSNSPSARTLQINLGALDKVAQGAPVICGQGLVGFVQRVAWTTCEVLLVADEKMTLHAQVLRTGARGRIQGQGNGPDFQLELTEILRSDDLRVGDAIVTSGLGKVFPRGLGIGEVTAVRTEEGVQHRVADVAPYVDFARLQRVLIVTQQEGGDAVITPEPLRPPSLRTSTVTSTSSGARP